MARQLKRANAKRADRPNPREDRNYPYDAERNPRGYREESARYSTKPKKKVQLLPRNVAQEDYVDSLNDVSKKIVCAMGPAGTGKSLLATLKAIQAFQNGEIEKIIIARPLVSVGDNIGFLPGTLLDKMAPWCIPVLDIFKEYWSVEAVEKLLKSEQLELANIGMFRGRTIKNAILIFDEAQNATAEQFRMMTTRIGDGSRMFINGDLQQHDRGKEISGFQDFVERLANSPSKMISVHGFGQSDIERHPVVQEVLRIYGDE